MYISKIITYVISIIALFSCCVLIAAGQSTDEEDSTKDAQLSSEENLTDKASSDLKENLSAPKGIFTRIKDTIASYIPTDSGNNHEGAFDLSTNGDDILQNFNFFAKVPFKFESYEVSVSGKYLQTFQKKDISSENEHPSEWKTLPKWKPLSKSYSFGLEGNHPRKFLNIFTFGGHIEYERDYSIVIDPHVHVGIFSEVPLWRKWDWIKGGAGIWVEGQQLSTNSPGFRSGLRFHIGIDSKFFNMVIEYLPHWNFREYRANASPELVFEFKPFGKELALVLHAEIDYYSEKTELTVEPLFDIDKWDIRWTQLFRVPF